ncbi:MAG: PUA domain-containing protein [Nitrososphaerales archaeon]
MKSYTLSKKDTKSIINKIAKTWPITLEFDKSVQVRVIEIDKQSRLITFADFEAVEIDELLIPFLKSNEILKKFPYVGVDRGAVPHICNGADVMRPGIVEWGAFKKGDIISIRESNYKKSIAVGIALVNQSDMEKMEKGTVVKNLHYVGDKFWRAYKQIQS